MPAITLSEMQKSANQGGLVEKSMVIDIFMQESDILREMPFTPVNGSAYAFDQEASLPTNAARGINEDFTANHGVITRQTEALKIYGGQIKVDRAQLKMYGENAFSRQRRMKVKSLARLITTDLIKGDETDDFREFDGLQARVPFTSSHHVENSATSGGAAPSLAKLDEAIDACGNATHILMPRALRRRLTTASRDSTLTGYVVRQEQGQGRVIHTYNDLPILIGYEASQSDTILPFTETPSGGGTAQTASIYVLRLGEDGVHGIQNGDMQVFPPDRVSEGVSITTDVEWLLSFAIEDPFAIVRMSSCTDADWAA